MCTVDRVIHPRHAPLSLMFLLVRRCCVRLAGAMSVYEKTISVGTVVCPLTAGCVGEGTTSAFVLAVTLTRSLPDH